MTIFNIILKNIWQKKVRTLFTVLGVSVSIAAFVALSGLTRELEKTFETTYKSRGTDLIVMENGIVDILSSSVDESYLSKIRALPEIEEAAPILFGFYAFNLKKYVIIYGWAKGSYLFNDIKLKGEPPQRPNDIIMGMLASKRLNKDIGDDITIKGMDFKITGIFQSKSLLEDGALVMFLDKLQDIKKTPGKVTAFNIKVKTGPGDSPETASKKIEAAQKDIEKLLPEVEVKNVQSFMSSNTPLFIITGFTWAVSVVAVIIVVLGIVNTMTTSVLERTKEIGILIAIGWRIRKIVAMVLYESVVISLAGGALGTAFGYGIMEILSSRPQLQGFMGVTFDPVFILCVMGASALLGLLSGIYPAIKAVSIEPIKVLRYE